MQGLTDWFSLPEDCSLHVLPLAGSEGVEEVQNDALTFQSAEERRSILHALSRQHDAYYSVQINLSNKHLPRIHILLANLQASHAPPPNSACVWLVDAREGYI